MSQLSETDTTGIEPISERDLGALHTRGCATNAWPSDPWHGECDCVVMEYRALAGEVSRLRDGIKAAIAQIETWRPYESRDVGEVVLHGTVQDLAEELRKLLDDQGDTDG